MSEEITYLPTFTGTAQWFTQKEPEHAFCSYPISRAIYRENYSQLAISFAGIPKSVAAVEIGRPKDLFLKWQDGWYVGGGGVVSCKLQRGAPDIAKLQGLWMVTQVGYEEVTTRDDNYVFVEPIPIIREKCLIVKIYLKPFQLAVP